MHWIHVLSEGQTNSKSLQTKKSIPNPWIPIGNWLNIFTRFLQYQTKNEISNRKKRHQWLLPKLVLSQWLALNHGSRKFPQRMNQNQTNYHFYIQHDQFIELLAKRKSKIQKERVPTSHKLHYSTNIALQPEIATRLLFLCVTQHKFLRNDATSFTISGRFRFVGSEKPITTTVHFLP